MSVTTQVSWIQFELPEPAAGIPPLCNPCAANSCQKVRRFDGQVQVSTGGPSSGGFGFPWGHNLSYSNRMTFDGDPRPRNVGFGYGWYAADVPYFAPQSDPNQPQVIVSGANQAIWFQPEGGEFRPLFGQVENLVLDASTNSYIHTNRAGAVTRFNEFNDVDRPGGFLAQTSPGGTSLSVVATDGPRLLEVQRNDSGTGGDTTESLLYEYSPPGPCPPQLNSVTLRRQTGSFAGFGPGSGGWQDVQRVTYDFYDGEDSFGSFGDLRRVILENWDGSAWQLAGSSYFRYFKKGDGNGFEHGLKYVVEPASYCRLLAEGHNPLTVSNAILSLYADDYFEYDSNQRVTKHTIQSGSRTFLYAYAESSFDSDFNNWKYKSTETRPDGSESILYTNYAGFTMLSVLASESDLWCDFTRYDTEGRPVLTASPSAVSGYDEQYADLLHEVSGNYEFLRDHQGLIQTLTYDPASGQVSLESLQQGEMGTSIKLREYEYAPCGGSSSSSSSSSSGKPDWPIYFLVREILYPSDTDQNLQIITTHENTVYPGTCALQQVVTTLPAVPVEQNGSGVSSTRRQYFDLYGNTTWSMDERGFIDNTSYDIPTGAISASVQDVKTSTASGVPAGWETPAGGGEDLGTTDLFDDRGRIIQSLGPVHVVEIDGFAVPVRSATWTVYVESNCGTVTRTGRGYQVQGSGSSSSSSGGSGPPAPGDYLVNPVSIEIADENGNLLESIQAVRGGSHATAPVVTAGKLLPSDSFPQTSYVAWTTRQYTDCCLAASQREYHAIPASGEGTSGTNYDQTNYGYDVMKRLVQTVTPGGTITWNVFDTRSLLLKTYIGTDDTGGTDEDPTGGGAMGNNMVLVSENEYDEGLDGGDGNLTRTILHVDGSTTRTTEMTYDFRDRRVTVQGEIDYFQKLYYDNRDLVIRTERYDTFAPSGSSSSSASSGSTAGNLIARADALYDDLGRPFRGIVYAVDPATGTVGNSLVNNTWYDASGNEIKSFPAGSDLFTKTEYDSLGRAVANYLGYDLDETTYAEAETVEGDTILEQSETLYDTASNVIQTTSRQRYHDAPANQTGSLGDPSTAPKARVTYAASWLDGIGRPFASAAYGTNGGSALSRPAIAPPGSDDVLVSSTTYDNAGHTLTATDPAGLVTRFRYDDRGREIERITNPGTSSSSSSSSSSSGGGGCEPSDDQSITLLQSYNADGNVATLTAINPETGNQTTNYTYGTTLIDSEIATSTLLREVAYPDSSSGTDIVAYEYNRQAQVTRATDQNGTVHEFDFDALGRMTQDRITTLGTGVNGAVRRLETEYDVRELVVNQTSFDNPTPGTGSVLNQSHFLYNNFAQLITELQSHDGAVTGWGA